MQKQIKAHKLNIESKKPETKEFVLYNPRRYLLEDFWDPGSSCL